MVLMSVEEIREALKDRRLDIVSEATGINTNTLGFIRRGEHDNPTLATLQKLSDYFTSTSYFNFNKECDNNG